MYLMYKDTKLIYFNFDEMVVEVINNALLPFSIVDSFKDNIKANNIAYNVQRLKEYLGSRVLSLSRDNVKKIHALFQIPQLNTLDNRVNLCIRCKGVSIQDSFWIKEDNENRKWDSINIRKNHFKEIVDISLLGTDPSITVSPICPELTTMGLFRKAWIRENDELYLLKSDKAQDFVNTKMEVLATKILRCTNSTNFVEYTGRYRNTSIGRIYVDKCKSFMTNEDWYFVEAWEIMEYCKVHNVDYEKFMLNRAGAEFSNMMVVDYLLINTDRHSQNYGLMVSPQGTFTFGRLAPLFDFNLALVADYYNRYAEDTLSQALGNKDSILDLAVKYKNISDIKIDRAKLIELGRRNKQYQHIINNVIDRYNKLQTL